MPLITTIKAPEQFILQINGEYDTLFDTVVVTVAGALPAGTVLRNATTAAVAADTAVLGVLAEDKAAGTQRVRVMARGNPTIVDAAQLSVSSATVVAALEAKGIVTAK